MKYQRTHAVNKAVLEFLEDRRHLSSTTFSGGVLTLNGDKDANNTVAVSGLGSEFVVAFCDSHGLIENAAQVKEIVIIDGTKSDTVGIDPTLDIPTVVETYGGKDDISSGNPHVTVVDELTASSPAVSNSPGAGSSSDGSGSSSGSDGSSSGDSGSSSNSGSSSSGSGTSSNGSGSSGDTGSSGNSGSSSGSSGSSSSSNSSSSSGSSAFAAGPLNAKINVVGGITTIEAGQSVQVDAFGSTLGNDTALTAGFQWNFGDTDSDASYNTLGGWNAGHIYNQQGTYTLTLTITGSDGTVSTASTQVNVEADTMRNIYVSTNGSDSNDGLSASSPIQSIAKLNTMITSNTQALFEDGDTFDMSKALNVTNCTNVTISSYGSGAQPVLMWDGARTGQHMILVQGSTEVTITGITFDSIFNTDTAEQGMPFAITPGGTDNAVVGCTFLNVGYAIQGACSPDGLLVVNNTAPLMTGLRGYFTWVQGNDITIVGNNIANSTGESLIRVGAPGANGVNVSYNNLTDTTKATIVFQAGTFGYASHNVCNDGPIGCGPLASTQFENDPVARAYRWTWAEFTDNTLYVPVMVDPGSINVLIQGNISYRDNWGAILINGYNTLFDTQAENITITGNTAINNGTEGNFLQVQDEASGLNATGIVLTNNVYIAPNLTPGLEGAAVVVVDGQSDLSAFTDISGNIWPETKWTTGAGYGEMFVGPSWAGHAGYMTEAQWNAEAEVTGNGDDFEPANLPSDFYSQLASFQMTGQEILAQAA